VRTGGLPLGGACGGTRWRVSALQPWPLSMGAKARGLAEAEEPVAEEGEEAWPAEEEGEEASPLEEEGEEAWPAEEEGEEAWPAEEEPVKPRPKKARRVEAAKPGAVDSAVATCEDLEVGTAVLYWGERRGVVRDSFAVLDEFWVTDEESGVIVRDEAGQVVAFKSADLQLLAPLPQVAKPVLGDEDLGPAGGVLLLGSAEHMEKIITHFGNPDSGVRNEPQQILAIPCEDCDPGQLLQLGNVGVADDVKELARKLRPDLHIAVRAFRLKQAVEQLLPYILRLEGYFCLSAVSVPYGMEAIEASSSKHERHLRQEVYNQVDLCVTASGQFKDEITAQASARRALAQHIGVELSDLLWQERVQLALRKDLKLDPPVQITDADGATVFVLLLPRNAVFRTFGGMLCFSEPPDDDDGVAVPARGDRKAADAEVPPTSAKSSTAQVQGKTISQWEAEQASLFPGERELPPGWLRIKSRSNGKVYFYNKRTQEATYDFPEWPLPKGWTKQVSKSTGKTYYFHAERKESTFTRPKA